MQSMPYLPLGQERVVHYELQQGVQLQQEVWAELRLPKQGLAPIPPVEVAPEAARLGRLGQAPLPERELVRELQE